MPPTQVDDPQIEYNVKRLRYLVFPALFVYIFSLVFLYYIDSYNFISRSETSMVKPSLARPITIQTIVFVVLVIVGFSRLALFRNAGVKLSFLILLVSTVLFMATICVPMYFWGGSHRSVFGVLLATVSGLTVIVAKKPLTRGLFGFVCVIAFVSLSVKFQDIFPNKGLIGEGSNYTGVELYLYFQTVAALATILMAILLSWKHAQDRTIFGDEVAKIHVLRERASGQSRSEMLQTSIKFAIDIDKKVLAGGGSVHSDCVKELVAEIKSKGQDIKMEDIWCAEWTPVGEEIIPETLRGSTPSSTGVNTDIQARVNDMAKGFLMKKSRK